MQRTALLPFLIPSIFSLSLAAQDRPKSLHEPGFSDYYLDSTKQMTVEGVILNLPDDVSRESLVGFSAVSLLRDLQQQISVDVASDGKFSLEIPENYPTREVWFWVNEQDDRLYYGTLLLRDGLSITLDYPTLKKQGGVQFASGPGVEFAGPDAEFTRARNLLTSAQITMGYNSAWAPIIIDRKATPAEKRSRIDSLFATISQHLTETLADFSPQVRELLEQDLIANRFGMMATTFWNENVTQEFLEDYLNQAPPIISNASGDYYSYFASAINANARRIASKATGDKSPPLEDKLKALNEILTDLPGQRTDLVYLFQSDKDPIDNFARLENALKYVKSPWVAHLLRERYNLAKAETEKLQAALSKVVPTTNPANLGSSLGSLPFGADLYTVLDYVSGEELLNKLRGSFPDNALYLDMWAVWCQPCLREMPHSAKLKANAKDLPVEFVYLCTDQGGSIEQWKNIIAQHQIGGTHLYVPKKVHQEIMKLFSSRGYPTYVLLKADGTPKLDVQRPSQLDADKLQAVIR